MVRRVARLGLTLVLLGLVPYGGENLTSSERNWAEHATLEVARINDILLFEFLLATSVTGDPNEVVSDVSGARTDWKAMAVVCGRLADPALQRGPTSEPPTRYVDTAKKLSRFQAAWISIGQECLAAVAEQDQTAFQKLSDAFFDASELLLDLGSDLPNGVHCPNGIPDPPRSCEI